MSSSFRIEKVFQEQTILNSMYPEILIEEFLIPDPSKYIFEIWPASDKDHYKKIQENYSNSGLAFICQLLEQGIYLYIASYELNFCEVCQKIQEDNLSTKGIINEYIDTFKYYENFSAMQKRDLYRTSIDDYHLVVTIYGFRDFLDDFTQTGKAKLFFTARSKRSAILIQASLHFERNK